MDCLESFALNVSSAFLLNIFHLFKEKAFALCSLLARTKMTCVLGGSHPISLFVSILKTRGDGFEPPLEEPESSVLPLDDPGI